MTSRFERLSPYYFMAACLIIIIPIAILESHLFGVSLEFIFLAFIASGLIFYLFRIESRFFILSALLLIWLCPYLKIYDLDIIAENIAIYAYYSLIVGVVLQFAEHRLQYDLYVGLGMLQGFAQGNRMVYLSFVCALPFIYNIFFDLSVFIKAISLYSSSTLLIMYYLNRYFLRDSVLDGGSQKYED